MTAGIRNRPDVVILNSLQDPIRAGESAGRRDNSCDSVASAGTVQILNQVQDHNMGFR